VASGQWSGKEDKIGAVGVCGKTKVKSSGQTCPLHTGKGKINNKVNVKGSGQECPLHTGKGKVKSNGRGRPFLQGFRFPQGGCSSVTAFGNGKGVVWSFGPKEI